MSKDRVGVVALVGVREYALKEQYFSTVASMLKHYREVPSKRKHSYIKAFLRRYFKLRNYIEVARVYKYSQQAIKEVNELLKELRPVLVIVDDGIYDAIDYPRKIRESLAKRKHEEYLKKLTDNLANYFRILLMSNPTEFREKLKEIEK